MADSGPIVVTGAAGFIGMHVSRKLARAGHTVVGVDNLNSYYDPALKEARLRELKTLEHFRFERLDLEQAKDTETFFRDTGPARVIHLAAQPGIRHSLDHPHAYVGSNVVGFLHVLEGCRHAQVSHLVYASSSSVYGQDASLPFRSDEPAVHPLNVYAATKLAGEGLAHAYANLYQLPMTGLRFFTVYGPWGRPDMALFSFTRKILAGERIPVFNRGEMARDFTYVDDIVEGVTRVLERPPTGDVPYAIFNLGRGEPVGLLAMISALGDALGKTPDLELLPAQPGEAMETHANVEGLREAVGYEPSTSLQEGMRRFVDWYMKYMDG